MSINANSWVYVDWLPVGIKLKCMLVTQLRFSTSAWYTMVLGWQNNKMVLVGPTLLRWYKVLCACKSTCTMEIDVLGVVILFNSRIK